MKVVQFNIYFGDHPGTSIQSRMKNLTDCLIEEDPDVICLQEVLSEFHNDLCDSLEKTHPYNFPDKKTGMDQKYGTVIFSKYEIVENDRIKFEKTSMGRDLKLILIKHPKIGSVYICTSHFESEFSIGCSNKINQYQLTYKELFELHGTTNIPIILCSDTNVCSESEKSFTDIFSKNNGWKDAWIENGEKFYDKLTFDSRTNPILIKRYGSEFEMNAKKRKSLFKHRLDRVLHTSDCRSECFRLIGKGSDKIISDHYGIICTISKVDTTSK